MKHDLTGQRFERLFVLSHHSDYRTPNGSLKHLWNVRCDCGIEKVVHEQSLIKGSTQSCGCLHKERTREASTTHGATSGRDFEPEYIIWAAMRQRCLDNGYKAFNDYGGRGITICDRWSDYANFLVDMGRRPDKSYTLDRTNNELGYSPDNCRWATKKEQANNRRKARINPETEKLRIEKIRTTMLALRAKQRNTTY